MATTATCGTSKVSHKLVDCGKQVWQPITTVKYNTETKEVFDENDNYIGQGEWNGETLQIIN